MLYFEVVTEGVVLFRDVSGVQVASMVPKLDRTFFTGYYCRYCFACWRFDQARIPQREEAEIFGSTRCYRKAVRV